jgi:DnaJ-class molecular chaperone
VKREAAADEVRSAYRALCRRHHPDRNPGNAAAAAKMVEINAAYHVLSNALRRAEYDRSLTPPETRPEPPPAGSAPPQTFHEARYEPPPFEASPEEEPAPQEDSATGGDIFAEMETGPHWPKHRQHSHKAGAGTAKQAPRNDDEEPAPRKGRKKSYSERRGAEIRARERRHRRLQREINSIDTSNPGFWQVAWQSLLIVLSLISLAF